MNEETAKRIAAALEQIALELAGTNTARELDRAAVTFPGPIPVTQAPEYDFRAKMAQEGFQPMGWKCPIHGGATVVPAGVSARTGRPYSAFVACPERGCNEKPPKAQSGNLP